MIIDLITNWFYTPDGEDYKQYTVGKCEVVAINQHRPEGEGDRWSYDIIYENGKVVKVFNPNTVTFKDSEDNVQV